MSSLDMDALVSAASRLAGILAGRGLWMATAESCTGGLIAAAITGIPGSSGWFRGGVVAYDNLIKNRVLGVPESLLDSRGAVSAECVEAMVRGAARMCDAEIAVSISGIAGPGGGSPEKPVGLVFSAIYMNGSVSVFRDVFTGDRQEVRQQAACTALDRVVGIVR